MSLESAICSSFSALTSLVDYRLVLDFPSSRSESRQTAILTLDNQFVQSHATHFRVLNVSLAYLSPGARLQINMPTELPPRASAQIGVSFRLS